MVIIELVNNLALLLALGMVYSLIVRSWQANTCLRRVLFGCTFGGMAIIGMENALTLLPGIIFDGRSVIIGIGALFGGVIACSTSMLIASVYRLWLGGAGIWVGVGVIFTSGALGLAYHYWHHRHPQVIKPLYLFLFGVVLHVCMLLWMLMLPQPLSDEVLRQITLPVLLCFPAATLLLGLLLHHQDIQIQTEKRYRTLFDSFPLGITASDSSGKIVECNPISERMLGLSQDEQLRRTVDGQEWQIVDTDGAIMDSEKYPSVRALKEKRVIEDVEMGIVKGKDKITWISVTAAPLLLEEGGVVVTYGDITDRKQMEEALQREKDFTENLVETAQTIVLVLDTEGRIVRFNPYLEEISGYRLEEVQGKNWVTTFLPVRDQQHMQALFTQAIGDIQTRGNVNPIVTKDGQEREIEWYDKTLKDAAGHVIGLISTGQDITERKQAEEALRESGTHLSNALRIAKLGPWEYDVINNHFTFTDEFYALFRTSAEEMGGYTMSPERYTELFVHPDDRSVVAVETQKAMETADPNYSRQLEHKIFYADGSVGYIAVRFRVIKDREGHTIKTFGVNQDITDRKRMEQELIRLERLRAVGELSAGVSHNLNNILTTILGPAQILKRKTDDSELLREVDDIITSARRARDLVHELHLSVRTQEEESLYPVSVDQIVQQAVQTSRPRWKDEPEAQGLSIEMVTRWGGVPSIQGTEAGLHDILTNFIFNAVDAMPEGGMITIETQAVGNLVQITFSDTGTGMDEETKRRIFEPFFTTKMDIGTGLGLSTVYNTVTRWGGTIEVDSTPGEGTTFTLCFPVWTEEVVEEEGETAVQSTRSGKILVVDDDEAIGSLLSRLLGEQHEVETVTDGRKALERFAPGKYDVVMIDLGMSGMSGDQLLKQVKAIDPVISTVLITGWVLPDMDLRVSSFDFQVQKPFTDLDEIEDIVARAIQLHDQRTEEGN